MDHLVVRKNHRLMKPPTLLDCTVRYCNWCSDEFKQSKAIKEKSRIRETKHHSTDADSSTNTTVGRTKNTQKSKFIEKWKKIIQNRKTHKRLELCQN